MTRGKTIRGRYIGVLVMLVAMLLMTACSGVAYTREGAVTLRDGENSSHPVQIAEIHKAKKSTTVYNRGTSGFSVCDYKMGKHGYAWKIHIGLDMVDASGNRVEADDVNPYMTGKGSGNAVSFKFKGENEYTALRIYLDGYQEEGVEVPIDELELPDELKMSKIVGKLE